jgi:hypothetical protein
MAYRDDRTALETRRVALEEELSALAARKRELSDLNGREAELARELEKTRAMLASGQAKGSLLDNVRVASPCSAKWEDMSGDERARFCGQCTKNVYNLSAMTRDEAEAFLRERTGEVCVRLYRRADGTVITSDCPVGVRRKRRRHLAVLAVGGGVLAAAALSMRSSSTTTMGSVAAVEMGDVPMAVQGGIGAPVEPIVETATVPAPPPPQFAKPPPHVNTTARGSVQGREFLEGTQR